MSTPTRRSPEQAFREAIRHNDWDVATELAETLIAEGAWRQVHDLATRMSGLIVQAHDGHQARNAANLLRIIALEHNTAVRDAPRALEVAWKVAQGPPNPFPSWLEMLDIWWPEDGRTWVLDQWRSSLDNAPPPEELNALLYLAGPECHQGQSSHSIGQLGRWLRKHVERVDAFTRYRVRLGLLCPPLPEIPGCLRDDTARCARCGDGPAWCA